MAPDRWLGVGVDGSDASLGCLIMGRDNEKVSNNFNAPN